MIREFSISLLIHWMCLVYVGALNAYWLRGRFSQAKRHCIDIRIRAVWMIYALWLLFTLTLPQILSLYLGFITVTAYWSFRFRTWRWFSLALLLLAAYSADPVSASRNISVPGVLAVLVDLFWNRRLKRSIKILGDHPPAHPSSQS
jgi:predicted CDP-diglyceride synthetase/phosphatidate cytidylyltransferase